MIRDGLQYVLEHFWNFEKSDQMLTPVPYLLQQNFKRYRTHVDTFLENIIIVNLGT